MPVPLLDLKTQYASLRDEILPKLAALFDSQELILGPAVESFENAVCAYTGAAHAVGMSSGTDALLASLMALQIGPGDAVITTPYSFFATAGSIARVGAEPVFVDISPDSYNMDPEALGLLLDQCRPANHGGGLLSPAGNRIRAIMPVHLFGQCAPLEQIARCACELALPVIEDAAQALGADYPSPHGEVFKAGAYGAFGCFSFYPTKNLGAFGDAGMTVCRQSDMDARLRTLRNHGMSTQYRHETVGGNFRLDALQAVVLETKLAHLDAWSAARRRNAALYRDLFREHELDGVIGLPAEVYAASKTANHHIYNQFVVRAPQRDALRDHLRECGIGHAVYYPIPLHLQPCFAGLRHREGDFPEAERASQESLALPIFPELTPEQIREVVETIAEFYRDQP